MVFSGHDPDRYVKPSTADQVAVGYFRKFVCNYARRHPQRKKVNLAIMSAQTRKDVEAAITTWYTEEIQHCEEVLD